MFPNIDLKEKNRWLKHVTGMGRLVIVYKLSV
jgi:hypothetical protein